MAVGGGVQLGAVSGSSTSHRAQKSRGFSEAPASGSLPPAGGGQGLALDPGPGRGDQGLALDPDPGRGGKGVSLGSGPGGGDQGLAQLQPVAQWFFHSGRNLQRPSPPPKIPPPPEIAGGCLGRESRSLSFVWGEKPDNPHSEPEQIPQSKASSISPLPPSTRGPRGCSTGWAAHRGGRP